MKWFLKRNHQIEELSAVIRLDTIQHSAVYFENIFYAGKLKTYFLSGTQVKELLRSEMPFLSFAHFWTLFIYLKYLWEYNIKNLGRLYGQFFLRVFRGFLVARNDWIPLFIYLEISGMQPLLCLLEISKGSS